MSVEPSDADLVAAAGSDPESFGVLFDRHFRSIHRYLARRVGTEIADDLAAEAFTVAFTKLERYDASRSSALPWLYGIATNLVRRHRRSEVRRFRALARNHMVTTELPLADSVVDRMTANDLAGRVLVVMAELPARDRDPLILHVWEGLPYQVIAEALNVPVGTIRSRINRARRRLRELTNVVGEEKLKEPERDRNGRT